MDCPALLVVLGAEVSESESSMGWAVVALVHRDGRVERRDSVLMPARVAREFQRLADEAKGVR